MKIITIAFALLLLGGVVAAQNPFNKVAISEVSSGNPDGVEIANFGTTTVDITGWIVRWWDPGTGNVASSPLNTTIAPNERIIITESNNYPEAPGGTKIYAILPSIGAVAAAFTVALEDAGGTVVDEVRVTSTAGAHPGNSFGGTFRGLATRSTLNTGSGAVSQERIWGLDSDAGADWTEQPNRSFGLINRNSGPRGSDNPIPDIRINEIDNSPDYIELYNASGSLVDLQGWFFLCDAVNGGNPSVVRPFPGSFVIAAGGYVVIGDGASTPAELPGGTPYVNLAAVSGGGIPWTTSESTCALYTDLNQPVDRVNTSRAGTTLAHTLPRNPGYWSAFTGSARWLLAGDGAAGRNSSSADTDSGADWFPVHDRTMGSANTGFYSTVPSHGDAIDVVIADGTSNQSSTVIINCGPAAAGWENHLFMTFTHNNGTGPFYGLGSDAFVNWYALTNVPPFNGTLDAQGSARWDFPPGAVPAGVDIDAIFYATDGTNLVHTEVLIYDS